MKPLLTLFPLLLVISNLTGQNDSRDALTKTLTTSLMENDTTLFKTLIISKQKLLELVKVNIPEEASEEEIQGMMAVIENEYEKEIVAPYLTFFQLIQQKVALFNIDLNDLKFEPVNGNDSLSFLMHADVPHNIFKHFYFNTVHIDQKWYLSSSIMQLSEEEITIISPNRYGTPVDTSNAKGELVVTGILPSAGKSNYELSTCISSSIFIQGIEENTTSESEAVDSSYVSGAYSYSYYVDNDMTEAGEISFRYTYTIKDDEILCEFYDFEHDKSTSKFKSIGILPKEWNEDVKKTFTENQYEEIKTDIKLNARHAMKMITKYCIQ